MIDWYSIEYLYPSSFKKFTNIMFPNVGVLSLSTLEFYDTKKLYYFFDKEGQLIRELLHGWKEYLDADHVLKTDSHFLFCETIKEPEWVEIL